MADNSNKNLINNVIAPYVRMAYFITNEKAKPLKVLPRKLLDYELFALQKGDGKIIFKDHEIIAKPGQVYLIQPGVEHSFSFTESSIYYIHFDLFFNPLRDKSEIVLSGDLKRFDRNPEKRQPTLDSYLGYSVSPAVDDSDPSATMLLLSEAVQLFKLNDKSSMIKLNSKVLQLIDPFIKTESKTMAQERNFVDILKRYMALNSYRKITIGELAQVAGYSESRCAHKFKESVGISPIRFHDDLRIREAKILIRESDFNISEIADKLGFDSLYDFSRKFKLKVDVSPREYRKIVYL